MSYRLETSAGPESGLPSAPLPGSTAPKRTTYHLRLCVRGAIRNRMFDGLQHNDGRPMSRDEAFNALCDCLKAGIEYVPVGECDNWDAEKGCLGHPSEPPNERGQP